jgi:hypothetical protein
MTNISCSPVLIGYFCHVKKLPAIFLLSIYMLSTTGLAELFKVNVLLEHYEETKIKDGPVSFLEFLVMHYVTDDGTTQDDDRDSELPFKSHGRLVAANSTNFILNRSVQLELTPTIADERHFYNYPDPLINSNFCDRVWNPPRMS